MQATLPPRVDLEGVSCRGSCPSQRLAVPFQAAQPGETEVFPSRLELRPGETWARRIPSAFSSPPHPGLIASLLAALK